MSQQPDDLVELLRSLRTWPKFVTEKTHQAADRIEADAATITELRQRVAELEAEIEMMDDDDD